MTIRLRHALLGAAISTLLSACGGGSVDSGIGGTGFVARGEISDINAPLARAVSTITVNGAVYSVAGASVTLDDASGSADQLQVGMVVTITGSSGSVDSVDYDDDVEGPIANLVVSGDNAEFDVLGVRVEVSRAGTEFDDITFDTLANGQVVEVSGFRNTAGVLEATRLEGQGAFTPDSTKVEVKGFVSALTPSSFTIGTLTVNYDVSTQLEDLPGGSLSNGDFVEAKGTLNAAGDTLTAQEIEGEDELFGSEGDDLSVEGIVSDFDPNNAGFSSFKVGTQAVDASGSGVVFTPASLQTSFANGLRVEAEGVLRDGVLVADELELEGEDIKVAARVNRVDSGASEIGLEPRPGQSVTVVIESSTEFEDEVGSLTDVFALLDNGQDFVVVEGLLDEGTGKLRAHSVKRMAAEKVVIEAPVQAFTPPSNLGTPDITVLGMTFTTGGVGVTDFEDAEGNILLSQAFYSLLQVGDTIELQDDVTSGNLGDGEADEVAFED